MELDWLIYPAIVGILFVAHCYATRRYADARWSEILTLGFSLYAPAGDERTATPTASSGARIVAQREQSSWLAISARRRRLDDDGLAGIDDGGVAALELLHRPSLRRAQFSPT